MTLPPEIAAWWEQERARILAERQEQKRKLLDDIRRLELEQDRLKKKLSPLRGRKFLEDYECAVSTFIKRRGGIKIPKDLKEEFGGWNRLHNKNALAVDEMAEELHSYGLIEEPTTNALLDGLKSGRKSARFSERAIEIEYAMQAVKMQMEMDDEPVPF